MEEKPFPAWSWSVDQCLKEYQVKLEKGLSTYDVEKRRERYGLNEHEKEKGKPLWRLVLEQFDDMLVKILLGAAYISFVIAYLHQNETGDSGFEAYVEPLVIVLILVLNAIVGVWQESNAEKALEASQHFQNIQQLGIGFRTTICMNIFESCCIHVVFLLYSCCILAV